ncbi:hypothetical protein HOLleu_39572 [Holothuria leucospilota]|uniref:TNFR-Cys domain-containing protein n=1 Tax=Holothuria leucospilota TaxID=206669 RepID=A0A9Q1BD15_HOLLE|nr:hypothetical protein HOLleu_39572 [Holothuria leucospilota]
MMMSIYSIIKLLPVAFALFELCHTQKIPQEYRTKCTVAENEWCFTDAIKSCPPGYHQNHQYTDCSQRRACCPCPQGTFQPQRNICYSCIECKNCSKTNQEVSIRCNTTHDTECGDTLTTIIPEAFTSEELPGEETVLPDTSPTSEEDPTTQAPKYPEKAAVVCAPTFAFILSHLFCVLIGIILSNIGCIIQKIKLYIGRITSHQDSSSSEEPRPKKKKGNKHRNGKQQKQTFL